MSGVTLRFINRSLRQSINPSSPIHAVTFDVGGTLIQPWPSVGHVYAAVAERHGLTGIPPEVLNRQFATAWKNASAFNYTWADWFNVVNQTFLGLIRAPLTEDFFAELYREFQHAKAWRIFDDVLPALDWLRSIGLKLGVISNWDERLRPLLGELKLDRYFQTIVVSCEAGERKPSPVIFQKAAIALELPPGCILHVGDSLALDVSGATAAGFHSLLLARGEISKTGVLKSLLELQGYINAL